MHAEDCYLSLILPLAVGSFLPTGAARPQQAGHQHLPGCAVIGHLSAGNQLCLHKCPASPTTIISLQISMEPRRADAVGVRQVIKLSDAVQKLPRQVTACVHGVAPGFLDASARPETGVYTCPYANDKAIHPLSGCVLLFIVGSRASDQEQKQEKAVLLTSHEVTPMWATAAAAR